MYKKNNPTRQRVGEKIWRKRVGGGRHHSGHPSVHCNHSIISPEHLNNILVPSLQNRAAKPLMTGSTADLAGASPFVLLSDWMSFLHRSYTYSAVLKMANFTPDVPKISFALYCYYTYKITIVLCFLFFLITKHIIKFLMSFSERKPS